MMTNGNSLCSVSVWQVCWSSSVCTVAQNLTKTGSEGAMLQHLARKRQTTPGETAVLRTHTLHSPLKHGGAEQKTHTLNVFHLFLI